jgi:hypothetical protein
MLLYPDISIKSGIYRNLLLPEKMKKNICINKVEIKQMDNPEKLAIEGTQDEEKQTHKNTTQYVLHTTMHKQTQITSTSVFSNVY